MIHQLRSVLKRVDAAEPANDIVHQPTLDDMADRIVNAQNRIVHCEAELERARMALETAQEDFAREITERRLIPLNVTS